MEHKFSVAIPDTKGNTYTWVAYWVLAMNLFGWLYVITKADDNFLKTVTVLSIVLSVISIATQFYRKRLPNKIFSVVQSVLLILLGLAWLYIGMYLLGLMMIGFGIFNSLIAKPQLIRFRDDGIEYPSFPKKYFVWKDVDNVLIKNGVLTIDLKDNRLFQFTLSDEALNTIDENSFNAYCKGKIGG